ncbi:hypothetical protein T484DRAFT_1741531 [Baffinella frigidus]|nr:hypothetical protein T484DRAFT_1741531 [Cryptophyta sp. CCMP2293]
MRRYEERGGRGAESERRWAAAPGIYREGFSGGENGQRCDTRATEDAPENVAARDAITLRPERQHTRRRRGGAERLGGREAREEESGGSCRSRARRSPPPRALLVQLEKWVGAQVDPGPRTSAHQDPIAHSHSTLSHPSLSRPPFLHSPQSYPLTLNRLPPPAPRPPPPCDETPPSATLQPFSPFGGVLEEKFDDVSDSPTWKRSTSNLESPLPVKHAVPGPSPPAQDAAPKAPGGSELSPPAPPETSSPAAPPEDAAPPQDAAPAVEEDAGAAPEVAHGVDDSSPAVEQGSDIPAAEGGTDAAPQDAAVELAHGSDSPAEDAVQEAQQPQEAQEEEGESAGAESAAFEVDASSPAPPVKEGAAEPSAASSLRSDAAG